MSFTFQSICVKVVNYTEGSITLDGSAEEVAETIYELSEMSIKDQREWLRSSWTEMEVDDGYSCDGEIIPDFLSSDLANIGWSAVRFEKGKAPVCLDVGVITTKRDSSVAISADNIRRTREIYSTIKSKIEEFSPAFVAAETPSWTRFPTSDRITAQFWGMLPSIVEEKNLAIVLRTPVQIKSDLAGKKKASKNEMIKAARNISGADDLLTSIKAKKRLEHAADAIGAAISSQKDKLFQTIAAMKRSKV